MIITDKSEVFQKLLKDIEDIKIKLSPYHRYYVGCDPIEEKKPEFKEGQWVIRTVSKDAPRHHIGYMFRIDKVYGSDIREKDGVAHYASSLRLATSEEIKNHLIRESRDRQLFAWGRFKWNNDDSITTINPAYGHEYVRDVDALTVGVVESTARRAIYCNGEWATPVFTKEPPKTIQELERLLKEFASNYYGSDLLSERDTDVELFLRRNDYK